ncbi:LamB/YcsF family protein [Ornithinimicrobium ciconiae]|uniref:5-oxoprolinase subunit A n=1 Tax=Ornithinimicrobium ciconiae TaxID=2594265 RepID=A0A516G7L9_9MICO|nr:5-oxoprolinase subunit PxpA [Ornithinimicrobium ciconiae]QDO87360.1 LamB/YcsF family protein [Ornithinimicrobium ciconiae]
MSVDLNSDLGEGLGSWSMGDDDALLSIVTSANVACGFHAGDPSIMRHVTTRAVANGVAIGAHVAYRDLTGFGRRFIDVDAPTLRDEVTYQIGALDAITRQAGGTIAYVKPHGGLYNAIVTHKEQAGAVVAAVRAFDRDLVLMGLPGSEVLRLAEVAGLEIAHEAFADRAYTPNGHLVSRKEKDSVLHDPEQIARRCIAMAAGEPIEDINGDPITLRPDSICVHGDTPGAVEIARQVRVALETAGVPLAPFTRAS